MSSRRSILHSLVALAFLAAAAIASVPKGDAQETGAPVSVAILDLPIILRDSTAAQRIRDQIEQQRQRFQTELAQQEQALQAEGLQLETQRASMTPEAIAQKQQEISQRVQQLRQQSELRRQQLEDAFNGAMDQVRGTVIDILTELAQSRGYTLVLNKSTVLLSASEFDITSEVLTQLNQRLPSAQVPGIQ
jgi:outer membrane protein